jgi:hypothetical protein
MQISMKIMHVMGKITKRLHIVIMHDTIQMHTRNMIAQKRRLRVTLDISCYDDLDVESLDWGKLLDLEGDEEVHASIDEYSEMY